jgi:hypothetical protein
MLARIYQPAKNAMQSGQAKDEWLLEFEPESARTADPLMGWTSSSDMRGQIRLKFDTKDEAIAYAARHGISAQVFETKARKPIIKAYADNFKYSRKGQWTH